MAEVRVLVVEDKSIVARDIQKSLKSLGYGVLALATSGEAAVQKAVELQPDLVLMDIMLRGEMDGVEAAQQIRERLGIPVIYLTAHSDEATLQRAKVSGPFGYVLKPFEERELHTTIEIALYRHRMESKIRELNENLERRVIERTAQLKAANEELEREIIERRRAEETEREQRALAEALRDTAAALSSTLDFEQVLERVLVYVGRVVPHDAAHVMLIEEVEGKAIARVMRGRGYAEQEAKVSAVQLPVDEVPTLRSMIETGQPLAIPSVQGHPGWVEVPSASWVQSYASAPIRAKGKVVGFLNLNSAVPGFFDQVQAERLQAFADQAGVAIENARLYSSLQEANAQLEAALKAKQEMLQNVSHELRTPLAMIYGYIGLLESEELGSLTAEQEQAMEVMHRQGDRLRFMVDRVLTLQAFEARVLQRIELNLGLWLPQAVQPWEVRAKLAGIELRLESPPSLPPLLVDPNYLDHVIANLLDNAIKFSPSGGLVRVRAWVEDEADASHPRVITAVLDQGVGIAPDKLEHVFGLFYQADGSATRRFGGMGIGLALCQAIVEAHGGRIWAESDGEGQGSTFYVSLPVMGDVKRET